ncbi:TlpA family protein disulfide reductase [Abyssisolibacter fermentans]|uniref:TlpA family protein disulfide reductase n=1 Tax=Abyssisolibacter fermentans TaxID=1766203 RepID=UPI000833ED45|nr:TlpA disulfide reductase family protein [Abyssisolibacter fermentans]
MKKILLVLFIITSIAVLSACSSSQDNNNVNDNSVSEEENPIAGKVIASFNTKNLEGNDVTNDIFKNYKVTMINIWGTYCGPCINEMPDLQKLYEYSKDKDINLIGIVGDIGLGQDTEPALDVVQKTGVKYTNILPDKVIYDDVLVNYQYVPVTIFVDSNGKILKEFKIGSGTYEAYKNLIDDISEGY